MDIVYILGTGSQFENIEIRYSLRSLVNMKHRNVFVIGEKCDWFSDKVIHISAEDIYEHKQKNAFHKLLIACKDKRISNDFILMNDDFFILKKYSPVYAHKGKLSEYNPIYQGNYYDAYTNTLEVFPDGLNYSLHIPFVYNKKKLAKILTENKPLWIRSFYGNMYSVGGKEMKDVKARNNTELREMIDKSVISTDDLVVGGNAFPLITNKFTIKSIYEK